MLTLGDPRGIGPEVMLEAARRFRDERPDAELLVLGTDADEAAARGFGFEAVGAFGGSEPSAGAVALTAIRRGVELCAADPSWGLVTGPVHKPALRAAGDHHPGQTELLLSLTGTERVGMLMAAEDTRLGVPLRILLATTHLPVREVPDRITPELIEGQVRLLDAALRTGWGIARPRIALCGLNPHASDEGLFGDEEARVMDPAVARLREEGLDVEGPLPADTVFLRAIHGKVDAVVAPLHDVGMAVFKTLAFGHGVNVTLGLPFVRTSPDHGTAFDIVGTGRADPSSALAALRLAARLASGKPCSP